MDYAFDDRTLLFTDDTDFPIDDVFRHKNMLKKWDGEDAVGNMGFMEPLVHNVVKKPSFSNRCLGNSSDDAVDHLGKAAGLEFGTTIFTSLNKNESNGNTSFIGKSVLPRLEPSVSAKRSRITNIQSPPVPTCQVYGCNKDLSSSKDYHKRHKVCDVHSKTPVVIVNGIHQRFCQQCSRFHKVAEFDEGKRSCRKRLAGHNERRRKPQFDTHLGSTYFSTDASETSLIFSRILPGGFFGLQYNEPTNHNAHLKLEEDVKFGQPLPKSVLRFHGVGKQYPSKNCLNVPLSSRHEFSASSDSGSALSLLSRNSEGISTGHPLICKENGHANNVCSLEDSATNLGEICTFDTNSSEIPQELNAKKLKRYGSAEGAKTVNLMELSLHLQRIEQQKYYGQVKLENGTIT